MSELKHYTLSSMAAKPSWPQHSIVSWICSRFVRLLVALAYLWEPAFGEQKRQIIFSRPHN